MNQRPIAIASSPSLAKIVGSSSSVSPIATAASGSSITAQVVNRLGPSSGRRAMK